MVASIGQDISTNGWPMEATILTVDCLLVMLSLVKTLVLMVTNDNITETVC